MTFGTDEISGGFRRPRQDCSGTRLMHSLTSIEHNVINGNSNKKRDNDDDNNKSDNKKCSGSNRKTIEK